LKIESISSFSHNLQLNQEHLKIVGLSGASTDELISLCDFVKHSGSKKWILPDDVSELAQLSLFNTYHSHMIVGLEKLKKKELESFIPLIESLEGTIYLLSSSSASMTSVYNQYKNQMLWLDLSQEKPWQKKDRLLFLLQQEAKNRAFSLDKATATYLLDNEEGDLQRSKSRLESCFLLAQKDKKITLELVKALLPQQDLELDFQWVDQLIFKKEQVMMPDCKDATDFLLFLGQMRYVLINALKIKSLQLKHATLDEIKGYFTKLSPQALSMQLKKSDDASLDYLEKVLMLVYDKELELKQEFHQPALLFIELIAKICELKLCLKQES
jgi:DNA polymerase III subunit delta